MSKRSSLVCQESQWPRKRRHAWDVGKAEVEVGIEFTKEVLKGVYQSDALVAKLRALKKVPPPPTL